MPTTKATKREKSPEMPALERIAINNSNTRINNTDQQHLNDNDKLPGINNKNNNKTDNNNNNKVIGILDLGKPSSTTKQRLNALLNNQVKYFEAESKYHEELHKLQSKYARVYTEIFEKRKEIVSGKREPSTDECQWPPKQAPESKENEGEKSSSSPEKPSSSSSEEDEERRRESSKSKNKNEEDDDDEKGVANFWLEVLQSSAMISDLILDHDEPVLGYLQDVRVRYDEDKPASSYTLEFEFAENPYFRNRVLTKTFEFKNKIDAKEPLKYRGPDLMRTIGSSIDWKPKKNVTIKLIKKKIKSRNRKAPPKIITKEEEQESFFCFFESHSMDDDDLEKKNKENDESKKSTTAAKDADNADKQVAIRNKKSSNNRSESDESNGDEMNDDAAELRRFLAGPICLMRDFTLAERMRTKLIPRAVLYMTGEIEESDSDDDADEDDDGDDDEDDYYDSGDYSDEDEVTTEDDDDDEDNDSDDDREGRAWSKRPACTRVVRTSGSGGGGRGGNFGPEECKQS